MNLITRRRTRVPHRETRRLSLGVRLHVAVTARRAAEFRGTLRPECHCAVDFIARCEAIQPYALFFYAEVLHLRPPNYANYISRIFSTWPILLWTFPAIISV
jgi:hypothetical protein